MKYWRWILSVFSFPIAGFAAVNLASIHEGPFAAAGVGFVAGFVIGLAQWLAARPLLSRNWPFMSAVGLGIGAFVGALVLSGRSDPLSLAVFGAITGLSVGLSQAFEFKAVHKARMWMMATFALWTIAWFITSVVIVDPERGYVVFGMSGAIVYTLATGFVLRSITRQGNS